MILIDSRTGSGELVPLFKPYGIEVESTQLDSGDLAWAGNGPEGPVSIGVERKRLSDLIQSMRDGRLAGRQIPKMQDTYSAGHIYLVVEGVWRCASNGELEVYSHRNWIYYGQLKRGKGMMYREVASFLHSVQATMDVKVIKTGSDVDTVAEMVSMYNWYKKSWKEHKTAATIYAPEPERKRVGFATQTGLVEKIAAQLPGVEQKAWEVGKRFKTVKEMINANEAGWRSVKGIGLKGARTIMGAIRGTANNSKAD